MRRNTDWQDVTFHDKRGYRLTWTYIGEGVNGDYNEEDPDDRPMLRADLWHRDDPVAEALSESGASYCTGFDTSASLEKLQQAANNLFAKLPDDPEQYSRRMMEPWTWEGK